MRLILLGSPGSGKGTQATFLAEKFKIPHISTGEILRQAIARKTSIGIRSQSYLEKGELVPDSLIMALIRERLAKQDALRGWVLDGFPCTLAQAEALDSILMVLGQDYPFVVNFNVDTETLVNRMLQRGRQDDNENTIRRRLEIYQNITTPLINLYKNRRCLINIDGNLSVAEVASSLENALSRQSKTSTLTNMRSKQ